MRYVGKENSTDLDWERLVVSVMGFSQWVGSEKLRKDTGWKDRRKLFSEGIHQYRLAYEVAIERGGGVSAKLSKRAAEQRRR